MHVRVAMIRMRKKVFGNSSGFGFNASYHVTK